MLNVMNSMRIIYSSMAYYKMTETDRRNFQWFNNNRTCNTLLKIEVLQSSIRGLGQFSMEFKYPITVIAGENGCGKSTILSLVSCAFHNNKSFCPLSLLANTKRPRTYYTYSDFFAFTAEENGLMRDIQIASTFLTALPKNTDVRSKSPRSGQWKDYDTRPKRAVSFLGINRILPPSESLTHRNYRTYFEVDGLSPEEKRELAGYMTQIFGRNYTEVRLMTHRKYRLYGCTRGGNIYTGFNMGAGENAVLQLLHEIINAGSGALIVVDEIELGLHVQAQKKLMRLLKDLCVKYSTQIVCSSHSASIIESVPPEGRVLLMPKEGGVNILYGITPEMAMSALSGTHHAELSVFVEDDVAKDFVQVILPAHIRRRIKIKIMGSADSSLLHAASIYLREGERSFVVVMDGDKRRSRNSKVNDIVNSLSDYHGMAPEEIEAFMNSHLEFLPGDNWPEKVIFDTLLAASNLDYIMSVFGVGSIEEMRGYLTTALAAGKHSEFYKLASEMELEESIVRPTVIKQYINVAGGQERPVIDLINQALT